jgi:hypothetical protein
MSSHNARRSPLRFLARLGALAGTAIAVSVCGSQDRFNPGGPTAPGTDATPPVVQIILPTDTLIEIADSLKFTVNATDNSRLKSAQVTVAGLGTFALAVSKDTTFAVGTTITMYTQAFVVPLPTNAAGQRIAISVTATDGSDNVTTFADTVRVNDAQPPVVAMLSPTAGVAVGSGDTIRVLARATDPSGVRYLGARLFVRDTVLGRIQSLAVDSLVYASRVTTRLDSFRIVVPASLAPGNYILQAFSADSSLFVNKGASADVAVTVRDVRPPTGTFNVPALDAPIGARDTLFISFHATDNVGIASVRFRGYGMRADPLLGPPDTTLRFQAVTALFPLHPADTNPVVRRLVPVNADSAADSVLIEAILTDVGGNVTTITRRIRVVSGPALTILRPVPGTWTSAGKKLVVEVQAHDPNGVRLVGWRTTGVVSVSDSLFYFASGGVQPKTVTFIDTLRIPGAAVLGTFTITPFGVDSLGDPSGVSAGITVTVQSAAADTIPPAVTFTVSRRIEATDSITVAATDPSGIGSISWRATKLGDTLTVYGSGTTGILPGTSSDVRATFAMNLAGITRYPTQVVVRATAADSSRLRTGIAVAETLTVVAGRTFALPAGSGIGDAIYNPNRQELYLSNTALDRIEVFSVATSSFVASIPVGSRPVGLALWPSDTTTRANADTLIVANSGGTNLSIVDLVTRVERQRYRLPNYIIQKVKAQKDPTTGFTRLTITEYDYSDRPQYVAAVCRSPGPRANCGNVIALYSTTPTPGQVGYPNRGYLAWENLTSTAVDGTKGHFFWEQAAASITLTTDTLQVISVRDSVPGVQVRSTILGAGVGQIVDFDLLQFQDSTFVRNSGNYLRALVGEGGTDQGFARVMSFDPTPGVNTSYMAADTTACNAAGLVCTGALDRGISAGVFVRDFITNRASRVSSIAINQNGRTMLVRADSIYAFNQTLGQTGLMRAGGGAVGMDFHPSNDFDANVRGSGGLGGAGSPSNRLVFAARPDSSIDVFDTFFYGEVTDTTTLGATIPVPIRNSLIGPVRAVTSGGNTLLFGLTAHGLVKVQLPTITNSLFPTPASVPRIVSSGARRPNRDPSPPRE